jgi:Heterokaryon incompatibility protein (HET)
VALKSNVHLRSENGGIIEEDFPLTVHDDMRLCRDMGWQYLGVDALCIVQDDEESRTSQISCMQAIYLHADLTVVAAGGMQMQA